MDRVALKKLLSHSRGRGMLTDAAPMVLRRQLSAAGIFRISLDSLIAIGFLLAVAHYYEEPFQGRYLILALIVFSLTFPGAVYSFGSLLSLARDVALNWFIVVVILLFFGYASGYVWGFPASMVLAWSTGVPVALFLAHATLPVVLPKLLALEGVRRTAVIAGSSELAAKLTSHIMGSPLLGIQLHGMFDDRRPERRVMIEDMPVLGTLEQLADYAKSHPVDLIYITLPMASQPRILKLLNELRDTTASIYFVPDIFVFDLIQARMDLINGIPVVAVCETPFFGVNGMLKSISDFVLASLILILISPLLLVISAGVKLSSPGPILFRQRRYGLDGKQIVVYKFRSMTVTEDGDTQYKQVTENDSRVTGFGAFLRRMSLDELPQFFNVLQGRMSIVGPRPHAIAVNEQYRKVIAGYMVRHKVKPGITGWAQVNGYRGGDDLDSMRKRIEYDLAYLRNWSLRLDLQIIIRTIILVFRDRRAY